MMGGGKMIIYIEKVYPDTYIPLHNCDEVFKGQYWWWR